MMQGKFKGYDDYDDGGREYEHDERPSTMPIELWCNSMMKDGKNDWIQMMQLIAKWRHMSEDCMQI